MNFLNYIKIRRMFEIETTPLKEEMNSQMILWHHLNI
jgi:hypothetical protein